jgi:hypothetical protein
MMRSVRWWQLACVALLALPGAVQAAPRHPDSKGPESRWGIAPVSARLAQAGYLVYFRYKVVDPVKAQALFHDGVKPVLVDRESGQKLAMPNDTKLGGLRSSPRSRPEAGKQYYVLFGNPVKAIHRGSHIDVMIDHCAMRDLTVQ